MVVVDIDFEELRRLTGQEEKSDAEFTEDLFALGLEYEGETEAGLTQLEFAPDRLDRLSVEGIARSLRYQYGEDRGVYVPRTNRPDWRFEVDGSVPEDRPYVTGAIARDVNLDEEALDSLIQLQEKLHATMGRSREKGAIGIHDLLMLKGNDAVGVGIELDEEMAGPEDDPALASDPEAEPEGSAVGQASSERDVSETEVPEANAITYRGIGPDERTFVPLDFDREVTPGDVLTDHPTGREYAPIVADYDRMPVIDDEIGLFSFPPVINGRRTEVTPDSTDLLIELTGTDQWTIDRMGAILCYALAARGATIEEVTIAYPDRELVRPDFEREAKAVDHARIESVLGIDLDPETVIDLAERSGLGIEVLEGAGVNSETGTESVRYEFVIPPYRQDVLGPLDVIDDLGRAYGFNDLEPHYPEVSTVGGRHERSRHERKVRETLVGLGFQDLLDFHLISESRNYERMGLADPDAGEVDSDDGPLGARPPARITEPYSEAYEIVRTWALPSLMTVLANNTHRSYPQDLAEVGLAAHREESDQTGVAERRTVAAVLARTDSSYEAAKSRLAALCRAFGATLETPATDHPSFISGRVASVVIDGESVGVIGEIHPQVLVDHDLEVPVAGFELRLDALR